MSSNLSLGLGLFLMASACTAVTPSEVPELKQYLEPEVKNTPEPPLATEVVEPISNLPKDPCLAKNAQEAWLALDVRKPKLGSLFNSEIYFSSQNEKMLAVSQQKREVYGEENAKTYIEVSAEVAQRGSRVGSFSQVIATREGFADTGELFASLPPFWQQQIEDPQAVLVIKHYATQGAAGFVKFENDIVTDLSIRLNQGFELRCRSGEACKCL